MSDVIQAPCEEGCQDLSAGVQGRPEGPEGGAAAADNRELVRL